MPKQITNERRFDMLVGALEGGSNYWYYLGDDAVAIADEFKTDKNDTNLCDRLWAAVLAGKEIPIRDAEDESEILGHLSLANIEANEQLMAYNQTDHWDNIVNEDDDAETHDVWFQFVVLKEIVYG